MNSIMDVNELFDAIRGIDLNGVIREIGRDTHILTQTEIIALAVTAAVGLLAPFALLRDSGARCAFLSAVVLMVLGASLLFDLPWSPLLQGAALVGLAAGLIFLFRRLPKAEKTAVKALEGTVMTPAISTELPYGNIYGEAPADYSFLLGRKLKYEVADISRSFVLMAGTLITDRVIANARKAGKIADLVTKSS